MADSEGAGGHLPADGLHADRVQGAWGTADDHPVVVKAHKELTRLLHPEDGDTIRIAAVRVAGVGHGVSPCTRWPRFGLAMPTSRSGPAGDGVAAGRRRSASPATGSENVGKHVEPSGWFFEFENPHYPDTDDTAMALHVPQTSRRRRGDRGRASGACEFLQGVPERRRRVGGVRQDARTGRCWSTSRSPTHNAMQDPSCPDIAGRVLESLGHNGCSRSPHEAVRPPGDRLPPRAARTPAARGGAGGA